MKARKNTGNNKGVAPSKRKVGAISNQWQSNPKQNLFMQLYISPESTTFGNAYQSAIQAGYNKHYANQIASPAINNKWMQAYANKSNITIDHIRESIADVIRGNIDGINKTNTKLKAIELLARLDGHMVERKQVAQVVKIELGNANTPIDIIN